MTPEITSPVPAQDEMGMDYIPVYAGSGVSGLLALPGTVLIDPVTVQSIGVRTASAERRTLTRTIHTLGRVDYDEQRITRLHPKVEGWIDELYVETTGEHIAEDHILLNIYSPQLVVTQQEYLLALSNRETLSESPFPDIRRVAEELVESTLTRLRLLDVPEHQIFELTQTGQVQEQLHIHSPADGIVVNVGARDGEYVTPQTELFTVADLSHVWVLVDVFEDELPWVRVGDRVRMTVAAAPGTIFEGQLTYIYPYAESRTRTVKARLEFDNPDLATQAGHVRRCHDHGQPRRSTPSRCLRRPSCVRGSASRYSSCANPASSNPGTFVRASAAKAGRRSWKASKPANRLWFPRSS